MDLEDLFCVSGVDLVNLPEADPFLAANLFEARDYSQKRKLLLRFFGRCRKFNGQKNNIILQFEVRSQSKQRLIAD